MGLNTIGSTGVGLPSPQALFPATVGQIPQLVGTNRIALPPGGDFLIPSGTFWIFPGIYSMVQVLDPVTGMWGPFTNADSGDPNLINSDGVNYRVINPTGFPLGAVVTNSGAGYTSVPTVSTTVGGSTWQAVVGGLVSALNVTTASSGINYSVPPLINIAAPPFPGVQATALCTISGGSIATLSIQNPGAGYTFVPAVQVVAQASDLNAASATTVVTNAKVAALTSGAGTITAVLLVNEGNNPLPTPPALTFAGGGGSSAAAIIVPCLSINNILVSAGGSGYTSPVEISTAGGTVVGQTSYATGITNTSINTGIMPVPRKAMITATQGSSSGVQVGVIVDGGLFTAAPTAYALPPATGLATTATFTLTMGGNNDVVYVTPV